MTRSMGYVGTVITVFTFFLAVFCASFYAKVEAAPKGKAQCIVDTMAAARNGADADARAAADTIAKEEITEPAFMNRAVMRARDAFMWANKHPYPNTSVVDGNQIMASAFVLNERAPLTADQTALLPMSLDDWTKAIQETVKNVKSYRSDLQDLYVSTANDSIIQKFVANKREILTDGKLARNQEIDEDLPLAVAADDSGRITKWKSGGLHFHAGSEPELTAQYNRATKELNSRVGNAVTGQNQISQRIVQQSTMIQQLLNVRNVILDSQSNNSQIMGKKLTPAMTQLLKSIESIGSLKTSQGVSSFNVTKDYHVPMWTWSNLHLTELKSEIHLFFFKTVPQLGDDVKNSNIMKFVSTMKPEDLKAFHLDDVAEKAGWWAQSRPITTALAVGTPTSAGGLGWWAIKYLYTYRVSEEKDTDACVSKKSESAFDRCRDKLCNQKYENCDISKPEVKTYVDSLTDKHNDALSDSRKDDVACANRNRVEALQNHNSNEYRNILEAMNDADFDEAMLGTGDGKDSDLYKFTQDAAFFSVRTLISQILKEKPDSPQEKKLLAQLGQSSGILETELQTLIKGRGKTVKAGCGAAAADDSADDSASNTGSNDSPDG